MFLFNCNVNLNYKKKYWSLYLCGYFSSIHKIFVWSQSRHSVVSTKSGSRRGPTFMVLAAVTSETLEPTRPVWDHDRRSTRGPAGHRGHLTCMSVHVPDLWLTSRHFPSQHTQQNATHAAIAPLCQHFQRIQEQLWKIWPSVQLL